MSVEQRKIYVLIDTDEDGETITDMPVTFGRSVRAYTSKARARMYAKRFKCEVVELDLNDGEIV